MRSIHAKPARCALRKPGTGRTLPARLGAHACSCRSTRNRVPGDDLPGGGCRLARALVVHGPRWHCATLCSAPWRRHVKECSDDLAAASEQVQDLCCGLRNVNPLACRYRHDHPPATSFVSITNSWQHGAAQRVPCLSMEGARCAKGLVYSLSLNRCVDACTWQSRLTVLDAALVVVQPGASIAARCTLKFPGIDSILCPRRSCCDPRSPARADHPFFVLVDRIRGVDLGPN